MATTKRKRRPADLRICGKQKRPLKTPEQEARAMAERRANEEAAAAGLPLPNPNPWDALDPTKVRPDATFDEIVESCKAFSKICRPRKITLYIPSLTLKTS